MAAMQILLLFRPRWVRSATRTRLWLLALPAAGLLAVTATAAEISIPAAIGSMVPLEQVTDIKAQPLAILAKFPQAGSAMARFVAQTLTREPEAIDRILSIIPDASPQQASAIGAGMVRGVRALERKQSALARSIMQKVMRSENPWLKTTFAALGPNYNPHSRFAAVNIVPTLQPDIEGDRLPSFAGRVGPVENSTRNRQDIRGINPESIGKSEDSEILYGHGMIVALLISDPPANGAVSTSPTE